MRFREALDALKKMSEGDTADAKLAKAALDAMPPGMKGGDEPASSDKPGAKSSQPSGAPSSKADSEAASSGPESDAEPSTKPSGKADKRDAAKRDAAPAPAAAAAAPAAQADAVTVQLAAQVRDLEARLAARDAADEKAARAKMYKDAGASPELIRTLDSVDFKQAKAILGAMPKPKQAPASALFDAAGKAARGSLHADGTPTRYSDAAERLDARMGLRSTKLGTKRDGNTLILGVPVPAEGSK